MNLFDQLVDQALDNHPEWSPLRVVVEKELLHHDIIRELSKAGLLTQLTFIGGTCLRACYDSNRLSEDLDFTGGYNFDKKSLDDLSKVLKQTLQRKYNLSIEVSEPRLFTSNVNTWKVRIITHPAMKHIPIQRINIDICSIPSHDRKPATLIDHYGVDMGTQELVIQVESKEEIYADKMIALAFRSGRIKNRDLWDIVWLNQKNVQLSMKLIKLKLNDRRKSFSEFIGKINQRLDSIQSDPKTAADFVSEMVRFVPRQVAERTLDNPEFWPYLQGVLQSQCELMINKLQKNNNSQQFEM